MYWRHDGFVDCGELVQEGGPRLRPPVPEAIRSTWEDLEPGPWRQRIRDSSAWAALPQEPLGNKAAVLEGCRAIARRPLKFYRGSAWLFELRVPVKCLPLPLKLQQRVERIGLVFFVARMDEDGAFESIVPIDWLRETIHLMNAATVDGSGNALMLDPGEQVGIEDYVEFFCDFTAGRDEGARGSDARLSPFICVPRESTAADYFEERKSLAQSLREQRGTVNEAQLSERLDFTPAPTEADPLDEFDDAPPCEPPARQAQSRPAEAAADLPPAHAPVPAHTSALAEPSGVQVADWAIGYQSMTFRAQMSVSCQTGLPGFGTVKMEDDDPIGDARYVMPFVHKDADGQTWPVLLLPRIERDMTVGELRERIEEADEHTDLQDLRILGDVDFSRMKLPGRAISFNDVEFTGHVVLDDTLFPASLRFVNCVIVGQLSARNATIDGSLVLAGTRIHGMGIEERHGTDARAGYTLDAGFLTVDGQLDAPLLEVQGGVNLEAVEVRGSLVLDGLCLRYRPADPGSLAKWTAPELDLRFACCEGDLRIAPAGGTSLPFGGRMDGAVRPYIASAWATRREAAEEAKKAAKPEKPLKANLPLLPPQSPTSGGISADRIRVRGRIELTGLAARFIQFPGAECEQLLVDTRGNLTGRTWRTRLEEWAGFRAAKASQVTLIGLKAAALDLSAIRIGAGGLALKGKEQQARRKSAALREGATWRFSGHALSLDGMLNVHSSSIEGQVNVVQARMGALSMTGIVAHGMVVLEHCSVELYDPKETAMGFSGGRLDSDLVVQDCVCAGPVRIITGSFGRLMFSNVRIRPLPEAATREALGIAAVTVSTVANFVGLHLQGGGTMQLTDSQLGGHLAFWRDDVQNTPCPASRIEGSLDLRRNTIQGHARLTALQVGGSIDLSHTRIANDLRFMAFSRGKHEQHFLRASAQMLSIEDAVIEGDAYFAGLDLRNGVLAPEQAASERLRPGDLRARSAKVTGKMEFIYRQVGSKKAPHCASIPGRLDGAFLVTRHLHMDGSKFGEPEKKHSIRLVSAQIGTLELDHPLPALVQLSDCKVSSWKTKQPEDMIYILARTVPFDQAVYLDAERYLRNEGEDRLADEVYVAMRNRSLDGLPKEKGLAGWIRRREFEQWQQYTREASAALQAAADASEGEDASKEVPALPRRVRLWRWLYAAPQRMVSWLSFLPVRVARWLLRFPQAPLRVLGYLPLRLLTGYFTSSRYALLGFFALTALAWAAAVMPLNYFVKGGLPVSDSEALMVALRYTVPMADMIDDEQLTNDPGHYAFRTVGTTQLWGYGKPPPAQAASAAGAASAASATPTSASSKDLHMAPAQFMRVITALAWVFWPLILISWAATARSRRAGNGS